MHKLNILSLRSLLIALFLFITFFVYSFLPTGTPPDDTDGDRYSTYWVDSVFASLDLEQRIAQLIILEVHSDRGEAYENEITRMIKQHNIGGVIFFNGTPSSQVKLTNRLQSQQEPSRSPHQRNTHLRNPWLRRPGVMTGIRLRAASRQQNPLRNKLTSWR